MVDSPDENEETGLAAIRADGGDLVSCDPETGAALPESAPAVPVDGARQTGQQGVPVELSIDAANTAMQATAIEVGAALAACPAFETGLALSHADDDGVQATVTGDNDYQCKEQPSSPEIDINGHSASLVAAVKEINRQGLPVELVKLIDGSRQQREYREHYFGEETLNTIQLFQNANFISDIENGRDWYNFVGMAQGVYTGGKILMENTALITLPRKFIEEKMKEDGDPVPIEYLLARFQRTPEGELEPMYDDSEQLVPANILELAPANGDWIIRLNKLSAGSRLADQLEYEYAKGGAIRRDRVMEIAKLFRTDIKQMIESGQVDRSISAIDYVSSFVNRLRSRRKINANCADLCDPPEIFFKAIELDPNSQDLMGGFLFLDRTEDVERPIENMRYLARPDDTTRAIIGVSFPFNPESDVESKNPKVKKIKFWEKTGDIRQRWMADIEVENERFKKLDPASAIRAQALYNIIMDLNRLGLVVERVAEQPYEVYSPHCIIEEAGVIRSNYQHLRDRHFDDPELQKMNEEVFTNYEKYPDEKRVSYPQVYDGANKLVLLGVRVLAKDGSRFRKTASLPPHLPPCE